jgi:hypothetical protein
LKRTHSEASFKVKSSTNRDGCLQEIIETYFDDLLQAGNTEFQKISESNLTKFQCRDRESDKTQFAGIEIGTLSDGFEIHQKQFISKIKSMAKDGLFSDFRSLRARLAWATLSRSDIACAVAQSAQVNEDAFKDNFKTHIKRLNAVVNHLRKTINQVLKFSKLDRKKIIRCVYIQTHRTQIIQTEHPRFNIYYYYVTPVDLVNLYSGHQRSQKQEQYLS